MASDNAPAFAGGILTITLFALTPTTTRVAISQVDGVDIGLIRTVGGGAIAVALILLFQIRPPNGRHQWRGLLLYSFGSFVLFPSMFSIGTKWTSAAHASLIMASMPLVTSAIGFRLDRRAPRPAWFAGAALALAGEIVLISIVRGGSAAQPTITGDLIVLVSCVSFCVGAVAGSRVAAQIGPWRPTYWALGIAGLALLPLAAIEFRTLPVSALTPVVWIALFHLTVGASLLACVAWAFALARGGIARVAPLQFAQPALALFFAAVLLGESIGPVLLACGAAILLGVAIAWQNAGVGTTPPARIGASAAITARAAARAFRIFIFVPAVLALAVASVAGACVASISSPASAQTVDVLLVLAADVSYSITAEEYELQRAGYVAAVTSLPVVSSIRAGPHGRIAICYIEWSGNASQKVVVDWTLIDGPEAAQAFADRIAHSSRAFAERTSISAAIDFSVEQINRAPFEAMARIIDISGDGDNNAGRGVTSARDDALRQGIAINGLVIVNNDPVAAEHTKPFGGLVSYFQRDVIGGPNSFVVVANDFEDFGDVLKRKLVTEIAAATNGGRHLAGSAAHVAYFMRSRGPRRGTDRPRFHNFFRLAS
jgi:drug/metabolite transporter (DMT)-like permease